MRAATRGFGHHPGSRRNTAALAAALFAASLLILPARAQEAAAPDNAPATAERSAGLFITVNNPLDSRDVKRITSTVRRFLDAPERAAALADRPDRRRVKIVFDFNPDGRPSCTPDFGPCHDLAKYLLSLQDVTTIAFVRDEVSGHTVLPVLACKEIVMSARASLGDVPRDQAAALANSELEAYREVAAGRGRCPAVVLKMADKDVELIEGTYKGATWYIDRRNKDREAQQGFVVTRLEPVLRAGSIGLYLVPQARKFGLCGLVKETRQEVAEAYGLPPSSLREDPLQGRTPVAWRVVVKGPCNGALKETVERTLSQVIAQRANLIILQLECAGGSAQIASDLAQTIRTLKDDRQENPVMTVAYVTDQARDNATFLALACTEIVMDRKARLGDFERLVLEHRNYRDAIARSLEELAREQGYSPALARGMLYPEIALHRVRSRRGEFIERRILEGKELEEDQKDAQPHWIDEGLIKPAGQWFKLNADLASELGVAEQTVEGSPAEALPRIYAHYGLDKEQVHSASMDWLARLAAFLRDPVVSVFLVMIGIAGLVLELKMPGVGLPGVVAAVCFVLYFWAQSQLAGHLTMLAVLLFLLGLILIGLEVFVVPGFGVTGISGIILVIGSLALATLVKKPETTHEWLEFGATLSTLGLSLAGAVVGALVLGWYLPNIPYARRLVLVPPSDKGDSLDDEEPSAFDSAAALLGAIGVTATPLRPAGKARFGEDFVDVIAEGSYVQPGARVQVIEVEGNRIVVKEV